MCGRYYVDDNTAREIERLVRQTEQKLWRGSVGKDIRPSDLAPALLFRGNGFYDEAQRWGFPAPRGKGVVFNARQETVLEKGMFRDSVRERRCAIPAACFYEWDRSKNKAAFLEKEEPVLFMAGFYREYSGAERFVILTTKANASVEAVHDRMPLILKRDELEEWMGEGDGFLRLLKKEPPLLLKKTEFEQQELDL